MGNSSQRNKMLSKSLAAFLGKNLFPRALDHIRTYTRLDTEGIENIPKKGPVIVVPNHSGVWGWDGMILQYEILQQVHRIPRTMLHNFWFQNQKLREIAEQLAFIPQDFKKAIKILKRNNLLILFPEAEEGNFKTSLQMYQLQKFRHGFITLALLSQARIVPCCILGAEETHLNLGIIKWADELFKIKIPLPLNLIPLPAKWKIIFFPSFQVSKYTRKEIMDEKFLIEASEQVRLKIQHRINQELRKRKKFSFS